MSQSLLLGSEIKAWYEAQAPRYRMLHDKIRPILEASLQKSDVRYAQIDWRIKSLQSVAEKIQRKYLYGEQIGVNENFSKITDMLGVRIIVLYEGEVILCEKCISEDFEIVGRTSKTEQIRSDPALFGYQGLHLDCKITADRRHLLEYESCSELSFEVQLRSIAQHAWSEVDHALNYKKSTGNEIKRRINRLAALFELADSEFEAIKKIIVEHEAVQAAQRALRGAQELSPPDIIDIVNGVVPAEMKINDDDASSFQIMIKRFGSKLLTVNDFRSIAQIHSEDAIKSFWQIWNLSGALTTKIVPLLFVYHWDHDFLKNNMSHHIYSLLCASEGLPTPTPSAALQIGHGIVGKRKPGAKYFEE